MLITMLVRTNLKMTKTALLLTASLAILVSGCSRSGDLDVTSGVGVKIVRSGCPAVAVPDGTGDVTLFDPASSQDASAIDVVASMTQVRSTCNDSGEKIYTEASFEVRGLRRDTRGARSVTLPYFSTVVQGGSAVVAKRVGQVTLQFADGQAKASTTGKAASFVDASADDDAALDPLADPAVKAAVVRSSFELLVGFQLTEDQLRYNVTR
jgi:hypothetical protein